MSAEALPQSRPRVQRVGLVLGPFAALAVYLLLPESYSANGIERVPFTAAGRSTTAVAAWMAIWWMTEAIPIYATALLPLGLFPLVGVTPMKAAAAPYGHELIFLFMGGLCLLNLIAVSLVTFPKVSE